MSIDFHESQGVFSGTGTFGRQWRIARTLTGWRLEFSDPGDPAPTIAGVHVTVAAAGRPSPAARADSAEWWAQ